MKIKTILLVTALIALAVGLSGVGESFLWQVSLPLGAILFGLALIFAVLEKETALLDEQNHVESAETISQRPSPKAVESKAHEHFPATFRKGATM